MTQSSAAASLTVALLCVSIPARAQWLNQKTPGIPRTADGKPDLSAAAPRRPDGKPDLSGLWTLNPGPYGYNVAADLQQGDLSQEAQRVYQQRQQNLGKDNPRVLCLPRGPAYSIGDLGEQFRIVQTPLLVAILNDDLTYRQVFLDGRPLPKDPNPTWMGYSIGHWEGDTLVVETNGYNDRTWLDGSGHPHSEALRLTERLRRRDVGHIDVSVALEDPQVYSKPWTIAIEASLAPDTEMLEYVCAENEKDRVHLIGTASDDRKRALHLSPTVLAAYVGTYELAGSQLPPALRLIVVTLRDEELLADFGGKDFEPVYALSEADFSGLGGYFRFVRNERGEVDAIAFQMAEGDVRYVRKR